MSRKEGFYWVKIKRDGVENWEPKYLTSPNIVNLLPSEQLLEINENRIPSPDESLGETSFDEVLGCASRNKNITPEKLLKIAQLLSEKKKF